MANSHDGNPPKRGIGVSAETDEATDFKSLLANFQDSINKEVKQTISTFESTVSKQFVSLVQQAEDINTRKFNQLNTEVASIKSRQNQTEADMATMRAQVAEMQEVLSIAKKAVITKRDIDADEWTRDAQLHVLRVGVENVVPKTQLLIW